MAHDCPGCGQACYCDGDDTWMESAWALARCRHACEPEDDELDYGAENDDMPSPGAAPGKETSDGE